MLDALYTEIMACSGKVNLRFSRTTEEMAVDNSEFKMGGVYYPWDQYIQLCFLVSCLNIYISEVIIGNVATI